MNNTKEIKVATRMSFPDIDIWANDNSYLKKWINRLVYQQLWYINDDGEYVLGMAESFNTSENTITITLRDDIMCHDGESFTASNLEDFINQALTETDSCSYKAWSIINSVSTNGDYDIELVVEPQYTAKEAVYKLAMPEAFIANVSGTDVQGTGEYKFDDNYGDDLKLIRVNEDEFDSQANEIKFIHVEDDTALQFTLIDGSANFITHNNQLGIALEEANLAQIALAPEEWALSFDVDSLDVEVRKAIAKAIDSVQIKMLMGTETFEMPLYASAFGSMYEHDLQWALDEMENAGYDDDNMLNIDLTVGSYGLSVANTIANMLQLIHINVNVQTNEERGMHDCQLALYPAKVINNIYDLKERFYTNGNDNFNGYTNDEVDSMFDSLMCLGDDENEQVTTSVMTC